MGEIMHIAFCCDDNYIVPASILLKSYFAHNKDCKTICHTFSDSLSEESLLVFRNIIESNSGVLAVHELPSEAIEIINNAPLAWKYLSVTTYYRLMLPYVLDEDIERVLYLDCDTMVRKDLSNYYFDSRTFCVSGSIDIDEYIHKERLKLDKYLNAGVLVMDIKRIRSLLGKSEMLSTISNLMDTVELTCGDQDLINIMFKDECEINDDAFNYQHCIHKKYVLKNSNEVKAAAVVHFITGDKPWNNTYCFPYTREYYYYLKEYLSFAKKIKYWLSKPKGLFMILKKHSDYLKQS